MLIDLWLRDQDLGNEVARLSWVVEGWSRDLSYFLRILENTASQDMELARMAVRLPWLADRVTPSDISGLKVLNALSLQDRELARMALEFPWFIDGVNEHEYRALGYLADIASQDLELGRITVGLPWFADGVDSDGDEVRALGRLRNISVTDTGFGKTVMNLPWVADGVADVTGDPGGIPSAEVAHLTFLDGIASTDLELARTAASLPWLGHKSEYEYEYFALRSLHRIIDETDPELARFMLSLPRFTDDITWIEKAALGTLWNIARIDIEAALLSAKTVPAYSGDFGLYFIFSIFSIMNDDPDLERWSRLTSQSWFADGLDHEEAALVIVLGAIAKEWPSLFFDLLQAHFTQAKTVSLPLAGDVNIWYFRANPFPPGQDVLTEIEDTARIAEEFTGLPFPTNDIVLLIDGSIGRGKHLGSSMVLSSHSGVSHETAHYYFGGPINGPRWLSEGGAEFIVALIADRTGIQSLGDRKTDLLQNYAPCVEDLKMENLWQLYLELWPGYGVGHPYENCLYLMAEDFFTEIYETMGQEAMSSAIKELSETVLLPDSSLYPSRVEREGVWEENIYRILLKHTPADRQDELRELYRRLHGGPFLTP